MELIQKKYKSYFTERGNFAAAASASAGAAATHDERLEPLEISNKKLQPSSQNLCGICYTPMLSSAYLHIML